VDLITGQRKRTFTPRACPTAAISSASLTFPSQRTGERLMVDLNAAVELGPHGQVMAILVRPQTKSSKCFAELMKRDTFSPPPAAHFWIPVTIKFTMH
jgi:hypothetical protein